MSFISLFKSLSNFQFPYNIEDKPIYESALWQVFLGTRKSDSLPVTIFKANQGQQTEPLISNAIHKSKVMRIPGLCRVLETFDSDPQSTFIITERVTPFPWKQLSSLLKAPEGIHMGIIQLLNTLTHLNKFVLGTISSESVFIDSKGQWILFGLELCTERAQVNPGLFGSHMRLYNSLMGLPTVSEDVGKLDGMQSGRLISKLLGGSGHVPKDWQMAVQSLSQGHTSIQNFTKKLQTTTTCTTNPLIPLHQQFEELHIKDPPGKLVVMTNLQNAYFDNKDLFHHLFPDFVKGMLIPELTNVITWLISVQSSNPSALPKVIPLLAIFLDLTIEQEHLPEPSKQLLYSCFALQDRQIRFLLLIYLPKIVNHLEKREVSDKIYPRFSMGLADTDSTLRLQTLKSIPVIVPYITERQLNNEMLRYLAKTQVDVDVEIRAWTVIIITKISTLLSSSSGNRANILATAFTKSLKDPNIKTRLAALYGLNETIDLFDVTTIANKILTVIAPGLLDKDPLVRSKAKSLFQRYLNKLEDEAKLLQDESSSKPPTKDIDFDKYCDEGSPNVEDLAEKFLTSILLTSGPASSESTTATAGAMDENVWANFGEKNASNVSDEFGSFPAKVSSFKTVSSNGAQTSVQETWEDPDADFDDNGWGDFSIDDSEEIKVKSTAGKPAKFEKSWNSDTIDDDWAKGNSKPAVKRTPVLASKKKSSILSKPKTSGSILTPRSSSSISRSATPSTLPRTKPTVTKVKSNPNHNMIADSEMEDDAWDTAW
ncbi:CEX1 (YOR112W) [Zygosaccharomyces parabailii]|nr:CEX1 (YOR112W) [Zygosaccharomyces parabailii]CDH17369.1 related to Cytoplasmic export protein 1 [Zygosaccharomyces bailii ISA1307]